MAELDGKVAVVTGASRGIGAEIARRFAAAGAGVVVTARTTDAGQSPLAGTIGETTDQILAAGGTAIAVPADLSRADDRERLIAQARERLGPPDILVSNAAVSYFARVEDFTPRRYQLMLERPGRGAVSPGHAGRAGDAGPRHGLDTEHLLDRGAPPQPAAQRLGRQREHGLRDVQGRP